MLQLKNKLKFLWTLFLLASPIGLLKAEDNSLSWWQRQNKKLPGWQVVIRVVPRVLEGLGACMGSVGLYKKLQVSDASPRHDDSGDINAKADFLFGQMRKTKEASQLQYWALLTLMSAVGYKLALYFGDKCEAARGEKKKAAAKTSTL